MYYKDCINNDPGLNLTPFFVDVKFDQNWQLLLLFYLFIYFFFLGGGGTAAALGRKVSQSNQLRLMKLNEYHRSRSFFELGLRSLRFHFFLRNWRMIWNHSSYDNFWENWKDNLYKWVGSHNQDGRLQGPCQYMEQTCKTRLLRPTDRWPWNLVCSIRYSSTTKIALPFYRQG